MREFFRTFWRVLRNEMRLLAREPSAWIVGFLFVCMAGYALVNGVAQAGSTAAAQAATLQADVQARERRLDFLQRILAGTDTPKPFENPANPAVMASGYGSVHAVLPVGPLSAVALGQSDLHPSQFKISAQSRAVFMNPSDIESPWQLLSGHFDLAFVLVYVMPLMIFGLSYNLLSGERESGTLWLLLSQPVGLGALLAGKVGARVLALVLPAVLVPLSLLLTLDRGAAAGSMALVESIGWWAAMVAAYALFWLALVVAVNAFGGSSATNAMVLVISWVFVVLVIPILLNLTVSREVPAPSRTQLATQLRSLTAQAMQSHQALLTTDYQHVGRGARLLPTDGRIEIAGRALGQYRVHRDVDARIAPDLERFDRQAARQREWVRQRAFLSPAVLVHEGMTDLAGTGGWRNARFGEQVGAFHERWKAFFFPRIEAALALTPADHAAIPEFRWIEEPTSQLHQRARSVVVQLLALAGLLVGVAAWCLRRSIPL